MRPTSVLGLFLCALIGIGPALAAEGPIALAAPGQIVQLRLLAGQVHLVAERDGSRQWHRLEIAEGTARLRTIRPPALPRVPLGALPDAAVSIDGKGRKAWLGTPTQRYRHGVLGDDIEAGSLHLATAAGRSFSLALDQRHVFEDRHARFADLDGDGCDEIIVVRSNVTAGAAIVAYAHNSGGLRQIAETPPIGTANRWRNPIGAADFDGDGAVEIASVLTPHIAGVLQRHRLRGSELVLVGERVGVSNHAIGSRVLQMSAVLDWDGDGIADIAVPDTGHRTLTVLGFVDRPARGHELARHRHHAPIASAFVVAALGGSGLRDLVYGLADGTVIVWLR